MKLKRNFIFLIINCFWIASHTQSTIEFKQLKGENVPTKDVMTDINDIFHAKFPDQICKINLYTCFGGKAAHDTDSAGAHITFIGDENFIIKSHISNKLMLKMSEQYYYENSAYHMIVSAIQNSIETITVLHDGKKYLIRDPSTRVISENVIENAENELKKYQHFLKENFDMNEKDFKSHEIERWLIQSVIKGDAECFNSLLEQHSDLDINHHFQGRHHIAHAAKSAVLDIFKSILNHKDFKLGSIHDVKDVLLGCMSRPLVGNREDQLKILEAFLAYMEENEIDYNPLELCHTYSHYFDNYDKKQLTLLLESPISDPNILNEDHSSILHLAINALDADSVKLLLSNPKVDVNIRNDKGITPLHALLERAIYLDENGKDLDHKNCIRANKILKNSLIEAFLQNDRVDWAITDDEGRSYVEYAKKFNIDYDLKAMIEEKYPIIEEEPPQENLYNDIIDNEADELIEVPVEAVLQE